MNEHLRKEPESGFKQFRKKGYLTYTILGILAAAIVLIAFLVKTGSESYKEQLKSEQAGGQQAGQQTAEQAEEEPEEEKKVLSPEVASFAEGYEFTDSASLEKISRNGNVAAQRAVLVNVDTGEIIAGKKRNETVPPASMTKILTLLVAVEEIESNDKLDYKDKFKFTREILNYTYANECSVCGFEVKEKVRVKDMLYGAILQSGGDAVLGLCTYISGSQEEFVKLMNAKCEELGISDTAHFTNAVGLYDDDLHCTMTDMAVILKAALENDMARKVLHKHVYKIKKDKYHPDGITLSNRFLRRIEDQKTPGEVYGAKTGFVDQSLNCAASYMVTEDGGHYICVTQGSPGAWQCIYDHCTIYNAYAKK